MRLYTSIGGMILLAASLAVAQAPNLSGTWKTQTKSARGTSEQTMQLTQTGDTFTGEMTTAQGDKQPVKDGKVNGNDIEFTIERTGANGQTNEVLYKGTVNGDSMSGTFKGASGAEVQWTATRAQ